MWLLWEAATSVTDDTGSCFRKNSPTLSHALKLSLSPAEPSRSTKSWQLVQIHLHTCLWLLYLLCFFWMGLFCAPTTNTSFENHLIAVNNLILILYLLSTTKKVPRTRRVLLFIFYITTSKVLFIYFLYNHA